MPAEPTRFWAPRAWLVHDGVGRWHESVELAIDGAGSWSSITTGVARDASHTKLDGPALPGLVDAHSHAFQRAFAGLAERRDGSDDDFWSWRDRMYRVALRVEPETLRAIAAHLQLELLQGGYTEVCEFHYLHHAADGAPYADRIAMGRALAEAAQRSGIGLTLLPVVYERAGFAQPSLRDDQRRFALDVQGALRMREAMRALRMPNVTAGLAIHSLRAAQPSSLNEADEALRGDDAPIHIHVSEQRREVDECVAHTGRTPIAWLDSQVALDARWQLVHATHATADEIATIARTGAGVVLCPTTEANLGDGLADVPRLLEAGVALSIGSDSNVTRDAYDELRLLEYGQRLALRRRNVAAAPERGMPSTANALLSRVAHGRAVGRARWGFVAGARADLVVLDESRLGSVPEDALLDALVFSGPLPAVRHVLVGGAWVLRDRMHADEEAIVAAGRDALRELWSLR